MIKNHFPSSLSIVVPCFNEEEVISETYKTLKALSEQWRRDNLISKYELLFVNNGSADQTLKILLNLYQNDPSVVILDLRKNFGFQGSIAAGLFNASYDMIVSIDADLQDDPYKIGDMIHKYYEGYEMVLGVRESRDSDSFFKRFSAQMFYGLLNILGIQSVYNHADFRLLSRSVVNELRNFPERVRYLRGLIFEVESKYSCVFYKRRKRIRGKSKFSVFNLVSFALDGIASFSNIPIRLISVAGFLMFSFSILGSVYVFVIRYIYGVDVPGWAFLAIAIFFFGGVQNLIIGIIGEYIAKIYLETKQRPMYIVRKEYRHKL